MVLLALVGTAVAQDRARVRWLPGVGGPVAGYLVHIRLADERTYPAPRDVGPAVVAPDGSLEVVLDELDPAAAYVLAVSAYGSDGTRSVRSNELTLPVRTGSCAFRGEGEACDIGDPCIFGACRAGACVVGQTPVPGTALAARLVAGRRQLFGAGSFVTLGSLDPHVAGAKVELVGADGAVLNSAEVPAAAFRVGRRGRVFRYVAPGGTHGGVRRLVLRRRGDVLKVRLSARVQLSFANAVEPLAWIVHVGSRCVRQLDLRCYSYGPRVRCN